MTLNGFSFAGKLIFCYQKHRFSEDKIQRCTVFNLVHAHKPKFGLPFFLLFLRLPALNFVFFPLSFPFTQLLLLSLPFTFHILSGCRKKACVNYGQSLEMGPGSIIGTMGHGTIIFAPKTDNVVFQFATSECRRYPKPTVEQIDLSQLYHLLTKNIWKHLNCDVTSGTKGTTIEVMIITICIQWMISRSTDYFITCYTVLRRPQGRNSCPLLQFLAFSLDSIMSLSR